MAKQIMFTFEGKDYTLEFTRRTVKRMEEEGFSLGDVEKRPVSLLPALFAGAFKAHHPFVKAEEIDRIFAVFPNKSDLISKLGDMYNDPILTLMDEPEETAGKLDWTASW